MKNLTFDSIVIAVLIIIFFFVIVTSWRTQKEMRWLDCKTTFDSILINRPANRGAFEHVLGDSLIFESSYQVFDHTLCDSEEFKEFMWDEEIISCRISNIKIPFIAYKPYPTDTIYIIRNGTTIYFKVPCNLNE